jgi:hypothetical protein
MERVGGTEVLPHTQIVASWAAARSALTGMRAIARAGLVVAVATAAASVQTSRTAVQAQQRGAGGTCDFRLAESTRYSQWTAALSALGVSANTTVNVEVLDCAERGVLRRERHEWERPSRGMGELIVRLDCRLA